MFMKRNGFTLVELLVVIGIIALLMAIIVPALQRSKQQARAVTCGFNIRQLLLGLFTFESDNYHLPFGFDDTNLSPPQGGWPGFIEYDRAGWWWFNYAEGFFSNANKIKTVLQCPSRRLGRLKFGDNVLCGNYGVNTSLCKSAAGRKSRAEFIGTPLSLARIANPGQTILIVDSGYSIINWTHATDAPPYSLGNMIEDTAYIPGMEINKDRTNLWPGQMTDAIDGRHLSKTVNVGFADGHVSRQKADSLFVEKVGDSYKNRSPLWRPK